MNVRLISRYVVRCCALFMVVFCLSGFTLDEIRELKRMGFTNEQIIELQRAGGTMPSNSQATSSVQVPPTPPALAVGGERGEYLAGLKEKNKGLLVVCATKVWPFRGPGYLNVDIKFPNGKWGGIGRANLLEYLMNGQVTPPVFEKLDRDDSCDGEVIVTHQLPIIVSRYYGELEMEAGTYEMKLTRNFRMTEKESGVGKVKRHKKFHGVQIKPGMATVISYSWNENNKFGLDHVMPIEHRSFVDTVAGRFGAALSEVKVQHNE